MQIQTNKWYKSHITIKDNKCIWASYHIFDWKICKYCVWAWAQIVKKYISKWSPQNTEDIFKEIQYIFGGDTNFFMFSNVWIFLCKTSNSQLPFLITVKIKFQLVFLYFRGLANIFFSSAFFLHKNIEICHGDHFHRDWKWEKIHYFWIVSGTGNERKSSNEGIHCRDNCLLPNCIKQIS